MDEKQLHEIIEEYREEFADPNRNVPNPKYAAEQQEYVELLKRFVKRLGKYSPADVRKMFDAYIEDGGIYFPMVVGHLLKHKPKPQDVDTGPYIPTYEETLEQTRRIEAEEERKREAEKNMTPEAREEHDREFKKRYEEYKALQRERGTSKRFGNVRIDLSDTESDDS